MAKKKTSPAEAMLAAAKKTSAKKKRSKKKTAKKKAVAKRRSGSTPAQKRALAKHRAAKKKALSKIEAQPQGPDPDDKGEDLKRGRPTKYRKWYGHRVYELRLLGATVNEICAILEISQSTFQEWRKKEEHFSAQYHKGSELAQAKIAAKLHHAACGYSHKAVHFTSFQGDVTETEYIKHYPPDVAAAKMILYNKHNDKWRPVEAQSRQAIIDSQSEKAHGPAPNFVALLEDQDAASAMRQAFKEIAEKYQAEQEL